MEWTNEDEVELFRSKFIYVLQYLNARRSNVFKGLHTLQLPFEVYQYHI